MLLLKWASISCDFLLWSEESSKYDVSQDIYRDVYKIKYFIAWYKAVSDWHIASLIVLVSAPVIGAIKVDRRFRIPGIV
jgi:hypothetical protein